MIGRSGTKDLQQQPQPQLGASKAATKNNPKATSPTNNQQVDKRATDKSNINAARKGDPRYAQVPGSSQSNQKNQSPTKSETFGSTRGGPGGKATSQFDENSMKSGTAADLKFDEIVLESNEIDLEQLQKQADFQERRFPQAIFLGMIVDGHRFGIGVMKYANGRQYEGNWENDLRHGKGFERYPNSNSYYGQFEGGKAHGKGVFTWSNGEVYDGEWMQGLKQGYGIWRGIHNDSYIGEWKESKAHGYGVHTWKNGDRYEGEWNMCLKHGTGTDLFVNQDSYTGEYVDGKPHGKGQYTWESGSTYVGDFIKGMKHGKGKWRSSRGPQCNTYEGDYVDDKKCGFGQFQWASGNTYKGEYKDDERDGYGEMYWTDGSCYQGEWIKGIQHGYGRMIFPDGTKKEGYFENNVYKIKVNITGSDGKMLSSKGETGHMPPPELQDQPEDNGLAQLNAAAMQSMKGANQ